MSGVRIQETGDRRREQGEVSRGDKEKKADD
jgi:hypothetical protein